MSVEVIERPVEPVTLERRQVETYWRVIAPDLAVVPLPKHAEVDLVGRVLLEAPLVQTGQVVEFGFAPKLVEPIEHFTYYAWLVGAEVELEVAGEPGMREVGGAGQHTVGAGLDDVRLAVQEPIGQAPHLDGFRA